MARPYKAGLDYFPLDTTLEDKIKLIESIHGPTGFTIWVKLLMKIYSQGYFIDWKETNEILFAREVNVDRNLVNECINDMLKFNIFNQNLYKKYQILTSRGIQKRYFSITKRRNEVEVIKQFFLLNSVNEYNNLVFVDILHAETDKESNNNPVIVDSNPENVRKSTQSKVKYSKEYTRDENSFCTHNVDINKKSQKKKKQKDEFDDFENFLDEQK